MKAEEFIKSKEPNTYIVPVEWLEEYAQIVLKIVAEKAEIKTQKKSNYGKNKKWQKVKDDEDFDMFEYETRFSVDKDSIINCLKD